MTQEPTGIKQLFQQMIPDGPSVKEGIVTSTSPLSVTLKMMQNDFISEFAYCSKEPYRLSGRGGFRDGAGYSYI